MHGLFTLPTDQLPDLARRAYECGARATAYRILLEIDLRKWNVNAPQVAA